MFDIIRNFEISMFSIMKVSCLFMVQSKEKSDCYIFIFFLATVHDIFIRYTFILAICTFVDVYSLLHLRPW